MWPSNLGLQLLKKERSWGTGTNVSAPGRVAKAKEWAETAPHLWQPLFQVPPWHRQFGNELVRVVYDDKGRQDVLQEGSIVTRNRAAGYYPEKESTRRDEGEDWGHIRQGELGNLSTLEGVFVPGDAQELRPLGPAAPSMPTLACYGTRCPRRCISYSGRQAGDSEVSKGR
jgi:hypothetical protein